MNEQLPELHLKYRPTALKHVVGQADAVKQLKEMLDNERFPHATLLTGPSGCGKTTIARILKDKLECSDGDYCEVNCAIVDGAIETVRGIRDRMTLSPMGGKTRIWYLDEVQSLSRAGFAQQALLKMLEDTPKHVYFILATTDPGKIIEAIKTRCTKINLKAVPAATLEELLASVAAKEGKQIAKKALSLIAENAAGSPREALNLLNKIINLETEEEQVEAVQKSDTKRQAIDLARAIISPNADWSKVAAIIDGIDEDPESVRRLVLAYCWAILKKGGPMAKRADLLIDVFKTPMFETGVPGKAVLGSACFFVCNKKA